MRRSGVIEMAVSYVVTDVEKTGVDRLSVKFTVDLLVDGVKKTTFVHYVSTNPDTPWTDVEELCKVMLPGKVQSSYEGYLIGDTQEQTDLDKLKADVQTLLNAK